MMPDPDPHTQSDEATLSWVDGATVLRPKRKGEGPLEPTQWALVVYSGTSLGRVFPLPPGETLVGRTPQTAIMLPDEEVSRLHARLLVADDAMSTPPTVEDLGSTNGTLVNGIATRGQVALQNGDRLTLGGHVLKLMAMDAMERAFHETLLDQSTRDPLTGLHNRAAILEEFRNRFDLSRRHQRPLTVMICDLDHFKRINDTLGHGAGDLVLTVFGERVKANLRTSDLAGRIGGEEFLMVLSETELEGGLLLAERLRQAMALEAVPLPSGPLEVTCSIGVTERQPKDFEASAMIGRADAALYRAKHAGRNQVASAG